MTKRLYFQKAQKCYTTLRNLEQTEGFQTRDSLLIHYFYRCYYYPAVCKRREAEKRAGRLRVCPAQFARMS